MRGVKILLHASSQEDILWALRHLTELVERGHLECNAVLMDKTLVMRPLREDENIRFWRTEDMP